MMAAGLRATAKAGEQPPEPKVGAPDPDPTDTELIRGEVAGSLTKSKQTSGGDIVKYGIGVMDQTLLSNRLVDVYHLSIVATRVTAGKRAFAELDRALQNFQLFDVLRFGSGVVTLKYMPR
jgi:hypothetical protein